MFSTTTGPGVVIDEKSQIESLSIFHWFTFTVSSELFGLVVQTIAVVQVDDAAVYNPVTKSFDIPADGEAACSVVIFMFPVFISLFLAFWNRAAILYALNEIGRAHV